MQKKTWTEAMIAEGIMENYRNTGKMPTVTMLRETGQNALSCQISKRGGFEAWSKRLGLSRDGSDSDTGWDGEIKVQIALTESGFSVERQKAVKWPFDLFVDGIVRVDVKSARFATYGPCSGWFYRIGKAPQADLIALHQLDTGTTYWIPWNIIPHSNVTISKDGGKWARFKNATEILTEMVESRKRETCKMLLRFNPDF